MPQTSLQGRKLIEDFSVVELNVCPRYNTRGYSDENGMPPVFFRQIEEAAGQRYHAVLWPLLLGLGLGVAASRRQAVHDRPMQIFVVEIKFERTLTHR